MNTLEEWVGVVCRELDIADAVQPAAMQSRVLDMARDVAHDVARPAAPLTAYLVGLAAGLTGDPEATADELAQRVCLLAQRWADEHGAQSQVDEPSGESRVDDVVGPGPPPDLRPGLRP